MTRRSLAQATETLDRRALGRPLCQVISEFHWRGWCLGTSGSFSLVVSRDPVWLLITRTGVDKARVDPESLVLVNADGEPAIGDPGTPSAKTILHCTIASVTGAGSVLHVHSVSDTLLGEHFAARGGFVVAGYEMLKGLEGMRSHEDRIFVPVLANSQDMVGLADEVSPMLEREHGLRGFLLAGHGLWTWGETLEEAKRHVEIFEFLFECLARRTRFSPFTG
ncbi:MAG: methylthioribulose 1-phosphate dehydratase [Gemmatimonadota bacterium]